VFKLQTPHMYKPVAAKKAPIKPKAAGAATETKKRAPRKTSPTSTVKRGGASETREVEI